MKLHRLLYCLITTCLLSLASCKEELDMTVLQKTLYEGVAFDEILVDDSWEVTIVQDAQKRGVTLEYSAFLEPYIKANGNGSTLQLGFTNRLNLPFNTVKNATLYVATLSTLTLDDAASVTLEGTFTAESLVVSMDNATLLRGGTFIGNVSIELDDASSMVDFSAESSSCDLRLNNISVFKGALTAAESLSLEIDNASRITLYGGSVPNATVNLDGGGFLNMVPMEVGNMEVHLDNASEASVNAGNRVTGTVNNLSKLYYQGHPDLYVECDETSLVLPL